MFSELLTAASSHQSALVTAADARQQLVYTQQPDGTEHQTAFSHTAQISRDQTGYLAPAGSGQTDYRDTGEDETRGVGSPVGATTDGVQTACSETADDSGQQLMFTESVHNRERPPVFTSTAEGVMGQHLFFESPENSRHLVFQEVCHKSDQSVYHEPSSELHRQLFNEPSEHEDTLSYQECVVSRPVTDVYSEPTADGEQPVFPESCRNSDELQFSAGESDDDPLEGCTYDGNVDLTGD